LRGQGKDATVTAVVRAITQGDKSERRAARERQLAGLRNRRRGVGMNKVKFLKKYTLPWRFEQTDRDGGGVILDVNGQLMIRLYADEDWDQDGDTDTHRRPSSTAGETRARYHTFRKKSKRCSNWKKTSAERCSIFFWRRSIAQ
jgi:hypothetical protein